MRKVVNDNPGLGLSFLYNTKLGRVTLNPFVKSACFSKLVGKFMDSHLSRVIIKPFIKLSKINTDDYECKKYQSFNDFFIRKIKAEKRVIIKDDNAFISPCDAKFTCFKIRNNLIFDVKHSKYSVSSIIRDSKLASSFKGGYAMVFRLSPDDYHRYCYIDDGKIIKNYKIDGLFHTVNPVSYEHFKVFKENTRECTLLETKHFKTVMYTEVGALLVGKIHNHKKLGSFKKGEEKGYFMYGGSTIVILVQKNCLIIDKELVSNSKKGLETYVKYGEKIGEKPE